MRARSAWLSHPKLKATWVAIAAGSLAGLAVLGACSQDAAKIVGTRQVPESPRLTGVVGGNAHLVKVCSDLSSTGGPVTVNVSFQGGLLEANAVDPDRINTYQYNFGPYAVPDVITSTVTISPNECKTVFQRNNTCPAQADCSDPLQHLGNRMWTNESNTTSPPPGGSGTPPQGATSVPWPNIPQIYSGIVNPRAGVFITAVIPNGYTMDNLACTNDDPSLPQSCVNGGYSSANVFHGSVFTYTFTGPQDTPCPAGSFTFNMNNAGDLLIKFDQWPAPNDNSYGFNNVGWGTKAGGTKPGHTFKDLVNSDHAGFQIRNTSGQVILDFLVDYLSATAVTQSTPSGYASLGVTGGDGGMLTGTATGITATTSLANNLNTHGFCTAGSCTYGTGSHLTYLFENSPKTINSNSYTLVAGSPFGAWDFHNTYFVTIAASKVATFGAGWTATSATVQPDPTGLHNSPAKACPAT